jgi:hypothetical protein
MNVLEENVSKSFSNLGLTEDLSKPCNKIGSRKGRVGKFDNRKKPHLYHMYVGILFAARTAVKHLGISLPGTVAHLNDEEKYQTSLKDIKKSWKNRFWNRVVGLVHCSFVDI